MKEYMRLIIVGVLTAMAVAPATAMYLRADQELAAVVNGETIYEAELGERLLEKAGKQVLDELIEEKLILQEAKAGNINVSDQQIDERIEQLKRGFSKDGFEKSLAENHSTLDELKRRLKLQLITQKLLERELRSTELSRRRDYHDPQSLAEALRTKAKIENLLDGR